MSEITARREVTTYVCQLTYHAAPIYLKFKPYAAAKNIDDADHFVTESQALQAYLDCWRHPEDYLPMIREKNVIAIQAGQLRLF